MLNSGPKFWIWFIFITVIVAGCVASEVPPPKLAVPRGENMAGVRILTQDGGRVSWSRKSNKIAFDRLGRDGYFDLWLMNSDGTGQINLTSDHPMLPNKHIGQPAWHPSEKLIAIQVQKAHVLRYADTKCTPGAGALNDL